MGNIPEHLPLITDYEQAAIDLMRTTESLMTLRQVPQQLLGMPFRYHQLTVTPLELDTIAPFFLANTLDPPESVKITYSADHEPIIRLPRLSFREMALIDTTYEDVRTSYWAWAEPSKPAGLVLYKDSARVHHSVVPYQVGPFSCEAVIRENLAHKVPLRDYEIFALRSLLRCIR